MYEGEVHKGKRHGFGTMRFKGNNIVYSGEWSHGKRNGKVKIVQNWILVFFKFISIYSLKRVK